jgi:DNA-directed RNA polymerase specialized sigma24 family protein
MQDRELVAGILTGDPDALAEAYDRYAEQLYAYCRSILPDPRPPGEAADAVADTFTIATARLQGLRDPDQLGSWLHAVARNECLRRLGTAGLAASDGGLASDGAALLASGGGLPEGSVPDGLRERVLAAGADNSPTGRARRATVTHRAGAFGPTGFPKPAIPAGPRWWHEVRRRPRAAAGVAAVAVAVVAAGTAALLIAGGTHGAVASTVALGGGNFATSGGPSGVPSSPAGGPSSASPEPTPASGTPSTTTSPTDGPTAVALVTSPGTPRSSQPAPSSPPPSGSPSPSPSPSSSPPPTPGTLQVTPSQVVLSAVKGKAASGTFLLTAVGGPVNFLITSPNAKVTVSPASGSLSAGGSWMTVTVTVRSKTALRARLTISPGKLSVIVVFSIKA